jgi:uncharacterized protein (TIGR03437 family)
MRLDRDSLRFTVHPEGIASSQSMQIANPGSGLLPFRVELIGVAPWLTVGPTTGTADPRKPAAVSMTVHPKAMVPGTYSVSLRVTSPLTGQSIEVPVHVAVSARSQSIRLTQSGLTFLAAEAGGQIPPQRFGVLNGGSGTMRWVASASTTDGAPWLRVSPQTGESIAGEGASNVEVSVEPRGLRPGRYSGLAWVEASGAANTPQFVSVFFDILPAGSRLSSGVYPSELVFPPGIAPLVFPGSREVLIYNVTGTPLTYRVAAASSSPSFLFAIEPLSGIVPADRPARIRVQPMVFGLESRQYATTLAIQFSDGSFRTIPLTATGLSPTAPGNVRPAAGCTPQTLNVGIRSLGQGLEAAGGLPVAVEVDVRDDCGDAAVDGSVTVVGGSVPVSLTHAGNGLWQGTMVAANAGDTLITVEAKAAIGVEGRREQSIQVQTRSGQPSITGILLAPSRIAANPAAPGALLSIFGTELADGAASSGLPLPFDSQGAAVLVGNRRLPLLYTSSTQINTLLPYDIEPNTIHRLIVRRGNAISAARDLIVADAQPAIFSSADGRAIAQVVQSAFGDTLVIYCTGLGAIDGELLAEMPAPLDRLLRTTANVRVRIGGVEAEIAFAGLAPGYTGLYQVNAKIPEGLSRTEPLPMIVEAAGRASEPVLVRLR